MTHIQTADGKTLYLHVVEIKDKDGKTKPVRWFLNEHKEYKNEKGTVFPEVELPADMEIRPIKKKHKDGSEYVFAYIVAKKRTPEEQAQIEQLKRLKKEAKAQKRELARMKKQLKLQEKKKKAEKLKFEMLQKIAKVRQQAQAKIQKIRAKYMRRIKTHQTTRQKPKAEQKQAEAQK